jgi:hypothetical protein
MQFDVFAHFFKARRPAFSTFFLNSTAHYQHAYWDAFEPERYSRVVPEATRRRFGSAILFGYKRMDALLGRFFHLLGDDATIVFCTALSQEAHHGTRERYRPIDFTIFAQLLELAGKHSVAPVMADQFYLEFESNGAVDDAERKLGTLQLNGERVLRVRRDGTRLFIGCGIRSDVPPNAEVVYGSRHFPFASLFYKVPTRKVADHCPDGAFWIRTPNVTAQKVDAVVPLTAVAPTILSVMGVTPPAHMRGPIVFSRHASVA